MQAKLSFAERDLALVSEGGRVTVTSAALPGEAFKGRIAGTAHSALVVPTDAVLTDGAEQIVYLAKGSKALRVSVRIGVRGPLQTEILSGLSAGDPVIVRGGTFVRDGDPVAIKKGT